MINLWVSKYRGDTFIGTSLVNYGTVEVFTKKSCETRPGDGKNNQKFPKLFASTTLAPTTCQFGKLRFFSKKIMKKSKISKFPKHSLSISTTPLCPEIDVFGVKTIENSLESVTRRLLIVFRRSKANQKSDFSSKNPKMWFSVKSVFSLISSNFLLCKGF